MHVLIKSIYTLNVCSIIKLGTFSTYGTFEAKSTRLKLSLFLFFENDSGRNGRNRCGTGRYRLSKFTP